MIVWNGNEKRKDIERAIFFMEKKMRNEIIEGGSKILGLKNIKFC